MISPNALADQARKVAEELMMLARLLTSEEISETKVSSPRVEEKVEPFKQSIPYVNDPSRPDYNPSPPFKVERLPERNTVRADQIAVKRGVMIVCQACHKPLYVSNRDITYGKFSLAAYDSLSGVPEMESVRIENMDGNIAIDCVLCNTPKSVYLVGRKPGQENVRSI